MAVIQTDQGVLRCLFCNGVGSLMFSSSILAYAKRDA